MKKLFVPFVILAALALLPATATAQIWADDFESYNVGDQLHGVGGWAGWNNDPNAGALVSNAYAHGGSNSVEIVGPSDLTQQFSITSGTIEFTSWMYIPSSFVGQTYYIMLSTYSHGGTQTWAMQPYFDSLSNSFMVYMGTGIAYPALMGYPVDQWMELKLILDLDEDWAQFYIDGALMDHPNTFDHPQLGGGWQWSGGWGGGASHPKALACLDLWGNNAGAVYYDDFSIRPVSLGVDTYTIPETTGGKVNFTLDATVANANRQYLILGSITGTSPGTPLPKGLVVLPLNWDIMTGLVIDLVNTTVFANFLGQLGPNGGGSATFNTLAPVSGATGMIINFAYLLPFPYDYVSRPVPVQIVP